MAATDKTEWVVVRLAILLSSKGKKMRVEEIFNYLFITLR